jgi:large subunit ribosomal protein L2
MRKFKPTTPGRRGMTVPSATKLSKGKPLRNLTKRLTAHAGRNSQGRITTRHQGGGHKKRYRVVDLKTQKGGVLGVIEAIEYDPYRTAHIARVCYKDGERRYVLASEAMQEGKTITSGKDVPVENGNRTMLKRIPVGTFVHNVELFPKKGGQLGRSAGSALQVLANEDGHTQLKLPSGEVRKVPWEGYGSIGRVSNTEHSLAVIGKAGANRWRGKRPTVRGTAMNAADHPYGGGEGRTQRGTKRPKTKWGKVVGGHITRKKHNPSSKFIIKSRKKKK